MFGFFKRRKPKPVEPDFRIYATDANPRVFGEGTRLCIVHSNGFTWWMLNHDQRDQLISNLLALKHNSASKVSQV